MARQLDRRVQRTRKMLRESLMSLILEEGYDDISILDITEKANLGRATFYLHFRDKDELLLEVMAQLITDFMGQVPQITEVHWHLQDTKTIVKLFDFAASHYDLYRILTIGRGGITAARRLQRSIAKNIQSSIQSELEALGTESVLPIDFIANHFTGSLLATIYWWLDNDLPYTPEEMTNMFQKVNQFDRERLMGIDTPDGVPVGEKDQGKRRKRSKEKESNPAPRAEEQADPEDLAPDDTTPDLDDKVKGD
jgi:AcrR family transcriptional regulator